MAPTKAFLKVRIVFPNGGDLWKNQKTCLRKLPTNKHCVNQLSCGDEIGIYIYPPVLDFGVAINFQQTHVDMAAACRSHSQSEKKPLILH